MHNQLLPEWHRKAKIHVHAIVISTPLARIRQEIKCKTKVCDSKIEYRKVEINVITLHPSWAR